MQIRNVKIESVPTNTKELSPVIHRSCDFCDKEVVLRLDQQNLLEKLSGPNRFFCCYCLRHGFHTKNSKHIMVLSFRSVIGYFYNEIYSTNPALTLSEINDYIDSHVRVGLQNPFFQYDPETMLWFVNFSHVGTTAKKISLENVLMTVTNILACFNLSDNVPSLKTNMFYEKYKNAITNFYAKRFRPTKRRHLIPTFAACGHFTQQKHDIERTRSFTPMNMVLREI